MIQIYEKGNTNYSMNGDMVLFPESCELTAKLNGTWKMELVHPLDAEGRWRYIEEECVVSAPTFMGKHQLFRIREVEKTDTEVIAKVMPVFLDAEDDCFLMDVRPTAKNGQQALDIMMAGTKYSGRSDITTAATAYFETRNLISALHGTDEPTFTGKWGGEILYDNYTVIINEHVGGDYGVEARYGKNMAGIDYHLDMSEVITRIIPVAYNGYKMSGNTPWVDSGNINKYEKKYIRKLKFDTVKMREDAQEEDEENGIIVCDTQEELNRALTKCCKDLFAEGVDLPVVSIDINMTELSGTEEYKGFEILETVGLGDTVRCRHRELDITTKERVAAIVWDCCEDRIKSLTLGEELYDYFDSSADMDSILNRISGAINDDGSVMAGMIKGFLNAAKTQLRLQNTVAKKQDVRAILFEDLDLKSELFGAMSLGTQGLQIAKRRTEDGRDWGWTTALTANGLIANIIVAGILSDKQGKNYWNLDTGEFSLSATGFKVNGVTADKYFKDNWTQEEIFNKLTNNGTAKGIKLIGNTLYINADYINSGILAGLTVISKGRGFIGSVAYSLYTKMEGGRYWFGYGGTNDGMTEGVYNSSIANFGNGMRFIAPLNDVNSNQITEFSPQFAFFFQPEENSNQENSVFSIVPSRNNGDLHGTYKRRYGSVQLKGSLILSPVSAANNSGASGMEDAARYGIGWTKYIGSIPSVNHGIYPVVNHKGYSNADIVGIGIEGPLTCGSVEAVSLSVLGYKSRISDTENYGELHQYCYEMASPYFGDIGSGETDESGECYVSVSDKFSETCGDCPYYVFLQKEGKGDIWIEKKEKNYFVVRGTPNLVFSWELKQKQKDYENYRLDSVDGHLEREVQPLDLNEIYQDELLEMEDDFYEWQYNSENNQLYGAQC